MNWNNCREKKEFKSIINLNLNVSIEHSTYYACSLNKLETQFSHLKKIKHKLEKINRIFFKTIYSYIWNVHVIEIKIIAMYVTIAFNKTRNEFNLNSWFTIWLETIERTAENYYSLFSSSFSLSVSFTIFFALLILLHFCTLFSFNRIYSRTSYHFVELFFLVVGTNNVKDNEKPF